MSSNKILLVGGAGYIGSVLARELLERGYAVRVFDRLFFGDQGIRDIRDRIELIVGDIRTADDSIFEDVIAVVNISGLSNDPTAEFNPNANFEMNTVATETLAKQAKKAGISRYIFASSCSVYYVPAGNDGLDKILDETATISPKAAYSYSKFEAEKRLLKLVDDNFSPVILRKGTVYGFSPRMRYDLVVNTFVRFALEKGYINLHFGGEMWRPMLGIKDAARAYIVALEAPEDKIKGEIFNVAGQNFRISELGLRVREALRELGINVDIKADYRYKGTRSYRVSTEKIEKILDFESTVSLEESVRELVESLQHNGYTDFGNPRYYNIEWMKLLEETAEVISTNGSIFGVSKTKISA